MLNLNPKLFKIVTVGGSFVVVYDRTNISEHHSFVAASKQINMITLLDYKGLRKLVDVYAVENKHQRSSDLLKCCVYLSKTFLTRNLLGSTVKFFPVLKEKDVLKVRLDLVGKL